MTAKAKKTPMCSVSLIAIKLKGLVAPGEALKNIWPLAGPNIAKKGGPLRKFARGHRQTHFGTFNFWVTSPEGAKTNIFLLLKGFARCRQSLKLYCNKTY